VGKNKDNELLQKETVTGDVCQRANCWQSKLVRDNGGEAGMLGKTAEELTTMGLEHSSFWMEAHLGVGREKCLSCADRIERPIIKVYPTSEVLPGEFRKVLAFYRTEILTNRIVIAQRVGKFSIECLCYGECNCEHNKENDEYYNPPGWYECIENDDECGSIMISETVIGWSPLPVFPLIKNN